MPRPEQSLGYAIGQRHTTYRDQEVVLKKISAAAPNRIQEYVYGKSTEGRPLRVYAISSAANIAKLDSLRRANVQLAESPSTAKIENQPAFVWINECIHGDETASFESSMALIYNLVASESLAVRRMLEHCVVIVNPVYNPDGHERFVVWFNSIATGSSRSYAIEHDPPSSVDGRTNHYRFDMNRDRISLSQIESQQEVAEFLRWRPQIYVDQHGETSSYFFPPTPMSINANADRVRYKKWTETLGKSTAKSFNKQNWTYFVRQEFDLYYPGYLDSWTTLSGAIGMTHETDGGSNLASMRDDGSIATLGGAAEKHFMSAMAVIQTAAENRAELLKDYQSFMSANASGVRAGKFRCVIVPPSHDTLQDHEFQLQLNRHGIKWALAGKSFQATSRNLRGGGADVKTFPKGTLVIDLAQAQGALAKALLDPSSDFEPEFVKKQLEILQKMQSKEKYPSAGRPEFYDTTAWNIVFGNGLEGYVSESVPSIDRDTDSPPKRAKSALPEEAVGYYWEYHSLDDVLAAADLLRDGVRVKVVDEPMMLSGTTVPRGSFVVMKFLNAERNLTKQLSVRRPYQSEIRAITTSYPDVGGDGPGTSAVRSLAKPSVAVVFGDADSYLDFSGIWWLLEKLEIPFTPIMRSRIIAELDRFSCIIFPEGYSGAPDARLRDWIRAGGTAIALGGVSWALGETGFVKLEESKVGDRAPNFLPGAIATAELDMRYAMSYGYERSEIPIPVAGARHFKKAIEGGGIVTVSSDAKVKKVVSGWVWPDETEKALEGTVWIHDQPVGRGHAVLFMRDPTERAMWPGLNKLLINAMFLLSSPRN